MYRDRKTHRERNAPVPTAFINNRPEHGGVDG